MHLNHTYVQTDSVELNCNAATGHGQLRYDGPPQSEDELEGYESKLQGRSGRTRAGQHSCELNDRDSSTYCEPATYP